MGKGVFERKYILAFYMHVYTQTYKRTCAHTEQPMCQKRDTASLSSALSGPLSQKVEAGGSKVLMC